MMGGSAATDAVQANAVGPFRGDGNRTGTFPRRPFASSLPDLPHLTNAKGLRWFRAAARCGIHTRPCTCAPLPAETEGNARRRGGYLSRATAEPRPEKTLEALYESQGPATRGLPCILATASTAKDATTPRIVVTRRGGTSPQLAPAVQLLAVLGLVHGAVDGLLEDPQSFGGGQRRARRAREGEEERSRVPSGAVKRPSGGPGVRSTQ